VSDSPAIYLTGSQESGPAGVGTAFRSDLRAVRVGGMTLFHGCGPWGIPGFVTNREWIGQASAADQFTLCVQNLQHRMAEAANEIGEGTSAKAQIVWLHLSDIAYLRDIDALWQEAFAESLPYPVRIVSIHPIRGSAKVELDALVGELAFCVFVVDSNGERPGQYSCHRYTDAASPQQVMNEEEIDAPGWSLAPDAFLFAWWDDVQGIWRGHTSFAKLFPALQTPSAGTLTPGGSPLSRAVAYPQRIQCEMNDIRGPGGMDSRAGGVQFQFAAWHPDGISQTQIAGVSQVGQQDQYTWPEWPAYPPESVVSSEPGPYLYSTEYAYYFSPQEGYIGPGWVQFRVCGPDSLWSRFEKTYFDVCPHLWLDWRSTEGILGPWLNPHGFSDVLWIALPLSTFPITLTIKLARPAYASLTINLSAQGAVLSALSVVIPIGQDSAAFTVNLTSAPLGAIITATAADKNPACEWIAQAFIYLTDE